jgi:hypothetical protein
MRSAYRRGSGPSDYFSVGSSSGGAGSPDVPSGGFNFEYLTKKWLDDDEAARRASGNGGEESLADRVAESFVRGRLGGRPGALKRHPTT